MSRDYKYRASPEKERQATSAWIWMVVGLLLGAFIMGLFWLKLKTPPSETSWVGAEPDRAPQRVEKSQSVDPVQVPAHKPRFEFYDKLRKQEIVVPDEQLALREKTVGLNPKARYTIQIASFTKAADAERLKARLALLGIEVRVTQVQLAAGKTRYRILAGPYWGKTALDKVRARLKENGQRNLLIRITS